VNSALAANGMEMVWDYNNNRLMLFSATVRGHVSFDNLLGQPVIRPIRFFAFWNETTGADRWQQAFGGGVDVAWTSWFYFNNMFHFEGPHKFGYNKFAINMAVMNPATKKYESFFKPGRGVEGDAVNGFESSINVYNKDFSFETGGLVGGYFRTIDGTICNSICWVYTNGTVRPLEAAGAPGTEVGVRRSATAAFQHDRVGTINAMIHSASKQYTYIGGQFNLAGNTSVSNIARYNHASKTWHDVAGGVDGTITSMIEFGEHIIVAGTFDNAGDLQVNNVARWNTVSQKWERMNFGLDGGVAKLLWWKGQILAVGAFDTGSGSQSKGQLLKGAAVWNGKRWAGLSITL
jgi:hypothetical protein